MMKLWKKHCVMVGLTGRLRNTMSCRIFKNSLREEPEACGRNIKLAEGLTENGKMTAAGLKEIEKAKDEGRWDIVYDSPGNVQILRIYENAF